MRDPWYEAEIEDYPQAEQGKVQIDEPHASGKMRDRVGNAHLDRRGDLLAVSSHLHRADIAREDRAQSRGLWRRLGRTGGWTCFQISGKSCVLLGQFWFQNALVALRRNLIGETQVPCAPAWARVNAIPINDYRRRPR
jgi:hypothetical protein